MPENFEGQNQEEDLPEEKKDAQEKSKLTFRNLRIEDFDRMFQIRNEIVLEEKVPFGNREEIKKEDYLSNIQRSIKMESRGEVISVAAELNGELVGWIAGHLVREKTEVPTASGDVLAVAKKARGRKISNNLFERWTERIQSEWGVKKIITATQIENELSREVHKKRGFKETEFFERNGIEFVRMEKDLN